MLLEDVDQVRRVEENIGRRCCFAAKNCPKHREWPPASARCRKVGDEARPPEVLKRPPASNATMPLQRTVSGPSRDKEVGGRWRAMEGPGAKIYIPAPGVEDSFRSGHPARPAASPAAEGFGVRCQPRPGPGGRR